MSRDISAELKGLRLHGMSQAWDEVSAQEGGAHMWACKRANGWSAICCKPSMPIGRSCQCATK